ncbi:MAG: glutamine synthetase [Granulosicoccus sp.]
MISEPLIFVATSDLAGLTRGKAIARSELLGRVDRGIGWVPTNALITCFDNLGESPYGSLGDLLLIPDVNTEVRVDFEDGTRPENFVISNIVNLDRTPWECCTRTHLANALNRLNSVAGLQLYSAFEHEFQFDEPPETAPANPAFSIQGFDLQANFGEVLFAALSQAGIKPDGFINEFGTDQYEVPIGPTQGVQAADQALVFRQLVHACSSRFGQRASFIPIRQIDAVGNGVHIHFSLQDVDANPVTYDPNRQHSLSDVAGSFAAGVLKYLPEFLCLTAATEISYQRLTPHRWSSAFNNLGAQDREAALRICPLTSTCKEVAARQFNLEYRAADATASPHLALAALVHAGVQGIEEGLPTPTATTDDLSVLDETTLAGMGIERLPSSLAEALDRFNASSMTEKWFGKVFCEVFTNHKKAEQEFLENLTFEEKCAAYGRVF